MAPISTPKQDAHSRRNLTISTHSPSRTLTPQEQLRYVERIGKHFGRHLFQLHLNTQAQIKAQLERQKRARDQNCLWMPRMDVYDDPDSKDMVATFELPGVTRGDMTMEVVNGKFVLEGKRQLRVRPLNTQYTEWTYPDPPVATTRSQSPAMSDDMQVDGSQGSEGHSEAESSCGSGQGDRAVPCVVVSELRYGQFKREIQLPVGIEKKHITATLSDGILKITWPRQLPDRVNNTSAVRNEPLPIKAENHSPVVSQ
ncbi:hypothetical protein PM082_009052 [Marasmius tenuissimus]|nr:hypothetical protein PM082_009052 [Marasmius tenuissimus]